MAHHFHPFHQRDISKSGRTKRQEQYHCWLGGTEIGFAMQVEEHQRSQFNHLVWRGAIGGVHWEQIEIMAGIEMRSKERQLLKKREEKLRVQIIMANCERDLAVIPRRTLVVSSRRSHQVWAVRERTNAQLPTDGLILRFFHSSCSSLRGVG